MRAIGYIRVSTEDQNLGPGAQRKAIEEWCERNGAEMVQVFEDHGVSGGVDLEKRLQLLAAIDSLKPLGASVLVVAKRDRLARDVLYSAMIERLVQKQKAVIASADNVGNGDGPEAQMIRGIVDVFAAYERAIIRARTKAALQVKKSRKERTGSVPYGFQLAKDGVHLEPNPAEQEILSIVSELRGRGMTLRAIAAALEERGFTPRGEGKWHPQTVSNIEKAASAA